MTIIILLMVTLLIVIILFWWFTRPDLTCPDCGSQHINPLSKQMLFAQNTEYGGYQNVSGLQTRYKVAYYCSRCKTRWTKTVVETS